MMKFKKVFLVSTLWLLSTFAFADDAKQTLRAKLATLNTIQTNFAQTVTDINGEVVHEASGELVMQRPNQLRWHTQLPDEVLLLADGTTVWQLDYFVEQVTALTQDDAVTNNPMMLLTSSDDNDWQQFDVVLNGTEFSITSLNEGPIRTLTLVYENGELSEIVTLDSQQQTSRLVLIEPTFNTVLPTGLFEPELPDGFVLDDQRS